MSRLKLVHDNKIEEAPLDDLIVSSYEFIDILV